MDPAKPDSYGMWFRCLRSLGIRPRKAYSTRHKFTGWALSEGANLKGLAEYCGTSVTMIERNYGRFIRSDFLAPLLASSAARSTPKHRGPTRAKPGTSPGTLTVAVRDPESFHQVGGWRRGELNPYGDESSRPAQKPVKPLDSRVSATSDDRKKGGKKRQ